MEKEIHLYRSSLVVRYKDIDIEEKKYAFKFEIFIRKDDIWTVWLNVVVQEFYQDYGEYFPVYNTLRKAVSYDENKIMDGITMSLFADGFHDDWRGFQRYLHLCEWYMSDVISDAFRLASYLFMMV